MSEIYTKHSKLIYTGNDFLGRTHMDIKTNNWQMRPHETKKLLDSKEHYELSEKAACQVRKIFTSYTSGRGLVSRIYKGLKN